jgi:hypothetical protein
MGRLRHGHTRGARMTIEYLAWCNMIQRCTNPKVQSYATHGARGIKVCARWLTDFQNFLVDMGRKPRPSRQWSLERKDNNGDYEPGNCCWATSKAQGRNKRGNRLFTVWGRTQCAAAWAEEYGMSKQTLRARLLRGWSMERILTTPVKSPLRQAS